MQGLKSFGVWLVFCLLLISSAALARAINMQRIATGLWGGPHVSLEVGSRSAKVEYDCAHGAIDGPLALDSEGKFQLRGTFTPERGGPVRAGGDSQAQPATYSGVIKGDVMTLTLKVSGSEDTETFTLEKGKAGKLVKCK